MKFGLMSTPHLQRLLDWASCRVFKDICWWNYWRRLIFSSIKIYDMKVLNINMVNNQRRHLAARSKHKPCTLLYIRREGLPFKPLASKLMVVAETIKHFYNDYVESKKNVTVHAIPVIRVLKLWTAMFKATRIHKLQIIILAIFLNIVKCVVMKPGMRNNNSPTYLNFPS